MQKPKLCMICNDVIISKRANQYCGVACRNKGIALKRDQSSEKNPKWNGGKKIDSTGYVLIKDPTSKRKDGYKQEHVVIVESIFKRELHEFEDVHHINMIKTDNRIENLCVMLHSAHMSFHAKLQERERDSNGRYN